MYLPAIEIAGLTDPVVQVVSEETQKIVYTLRIKGNSFQPKVFKAGKYEIRVGEPGSKNLKIFMGMKATASAEESGTMEIEFEVDKSNH